MKLITEEGGYIVFDTKTNTITETNDKKKESFNLEDYNTEWFNSCLEHNYKILLKKIKLYEKRLSIKPGESHKELIEDGYMEFTFLQPNQRKKIEEKLKIASTDFKNLTSKLQNHENIQI